MDIGNKIKQLRYRSSLTQEQLADRLGLSPQAISKWENAAAMPDISLLPDLAEIFGISIDELLILQSTRRCGALKTAWMFRMILIRTCSANMRNS